MVWKVVKWAMEVFVVDTKMGELVTIVEKIVLELVVAVEEVPCSVVKVVDVVGTSHYAMTL